MAIITSVVGGRYGATGRGIGDEFARRGSGGDLYAWVGIGDPAGDWSRVGGGVLVDVGLGVPVL